MVSSFSFILSAVIETLIFPVHLQSAISVPHPLHTPWAALSSVDHFPFSWVKGKKPFPRIFLPRRSHQDAKQLNRRAWFRREPVALAGAELGLPLSAFHRRKRQRNPSAGGVAKGGYLLYCWGLAAAPKSPRAGRRDSFCLVVLPGGSTRSEHSEGPGRTGGGSAGPGTPGGGTARGHGCGRNPRRGWGI